MHINCIIESSSLILYSFNKGSVTVLLCNETRTVHVCILGWHWVFVQTNRGRSYTKKSFKMWIWANCVWWSLKTKTTNRKSLLLKLIHFWQSHIIVFFKSGCKCFFLFEHEYAYLNRHNGVLNMFLMYNCIFSLIS